MGRHKLSRQIQLSRILEEYPEMLLLPPAQYRACKECWFKQGGQPCPLSEGKELSLAECVEKASKWNTGMLEGFGRLFEVEEILQSGMPNWKVRYKMGGEERFVNVKAKNPEKATEEFRKNLPRAEVIAFERVF